MKKKILMFLVFGISLIMYLGVFIETKGIPEGVKCTDQAYIPDRKWVSVGTCTNLGTGQVFEIYDCIDTGSGCEEVTCRSVTGCKETRTANPN
jgi:bifunctional N-acetylglucosamine-1-phosphate-uridyltransferase/glucosamine-1-phosphate-acetyltransferase GlmU-like protein